jgi:phosphatidylglycerophosphate synthase
MISYATIRRNYQSHARFEDIVVDYYAKVISPLITPALVKAKITPNKVTVLMMIVGVVGAALFAVPQIICKAIGLLFIHLWYVLDCCDGEVARITKTFSKFGTEIDFTAHVVNHPLFNIAFVLALVGMSRYDTKFLLSVSIVCISAEMVLRNLMGFAHIYDLKIDKGAAVGRKTGLLKDAAVQFVNLFTMYPNFVLVFPVVYFVDWRFGTSIAVWYLLIQTVMSSLLAIWTSSKWIARIVSV